MKEVDSELMKSDSNYQCTFTVFTPTYNRAHTLHRVYESLQAQTFRDFEWLIVDDGSTDYTSERIKEWSARALFPIHYYFQPNSGKHVAFNKAVPLALGKFFLIADSDDAFVPTTLERFLFHWNSIPEEQKDSFSGVTCLCQDESGRRMGPEYPFDPTDSNLLEIIYRYKVRQEQWVLHRTEILRKFPYPEVPGEKFVLEGFVWNQIAREYKARFVNEALRIYHQGESDQLSKNLPKAHTLTTIFYAQLLNQDIAWFRYAPFQFWRGAVVYAHYSFLIQNSFRAQWQALASRKARLLWLTGVIPGYLLAKRDSWRESDQTLLSDRSVTNGHHR